MPLSLAQLAQRIVGWRGPVTTKTGQLESDFKRLFFDVVTQSDDVTGTAQTTATAAQTTANTAQTTATAAQATADSAGHQVQGQSAGWHTDDVGTQPPNNSTIDLVATVYDETGASVATRTLRGTYTTAADTIAVTDVSSTGEATTYTVANDASDTPVATVTHTASGRKGYLSWSFVDETVVGSVPIAGAGK